MEIKEILQWYKELPSMPGNLSSLQEEEWKKNHPEIFNKPYPYEKFQGEIVNNCPLLISNITKEEITGGLNYYLDYHFGPSGEKISYTKGCRCTTYLQTNFHIKYDYEKFIGQIHFNKNEMIEVDGFIFEIYFGMGYPKQFDKNSLSLYLTLSSIKQINNKYYYADTLDESLVYKTWFSRLFG